MFEVMGGGLEGGGGGVQSLFTLAPYSAGLHFKGNTKQRSIITLVIEVESKHRLTAHLQLICGLLCYKMTFESSENKAESPCHFVSQSAHVMS